MYITMVSSVASLRLSVFTGTAIVRALVKKGAHVIFTGRNAKAGSDICRDINLEDSSSQVDFVPSDLSSLENVRYFAEGLKAKSM